MIEFPITLTSGGSVCMPGYVFALALGYTKNRGVYRLAVTASGEWEGLTIRCFWHVPDGKDPSSSLVVDGYVAVPASVTAQPGSGCITFEGSDGAKVMTSADLRYRVSANSGTEDGTPTPDAPVPIVSAGDGGTIAVTLSDGNGKTQTLTLPTPTGLPGIPVTSGGNYTDSTCQQWVCDEVDLERGVKVQRIGKERVNTSDGGINEQYRLALDIPGNEGKDGAFPCFISITLFTSWTSCVAGSKLYLKNIAKSEGSFYTAEELKALAIDVDFVYQLATPIETPLTPAEIAAYKALTAYGPDTVMQASDGAGVKLEYQRDVNIAIKRIEDAVASMT